MVLDTTFRNGSDRGTFLDPTKYRNPAIVGVETANAQPNTLGLRQIMFAVTDIDDTVERLRAYLKLRHAVIVGFLGQ